MGCGTSLLGVAFREKNEEAVLDIVDGYDAQRLDSQKILIRAIETRMRVVARLVIARGIPRPSLDRQYSLLDGVHTTALTHACRFGMQDVALKLLASGCDPTIMDTTIKGSVLTGNALLLAVQSNMRLVVKRILKKTDAYTFNASTLREALSVSCRRGRDRIAALLIDRGADVHKVDEFGHSAVYYGKLHKLIRVMNRCGIKPL